MIATIVISLVVVVIFSIVSYNVGEDSGKLKQHENDSEDVRVKMQAEYNRGIKNGQTDLSRKDEQIKLLKKEIADAKNARDAAEQSNLKLSNRTDVLEAERDQYVDQLSDMEDQVMQLNLKLDMEAKKSLEFARKNASLDAQIQQLKENHGYDLIDHGNTIRTETWNKLLSDIETFIESKKMIVKPDNNVLAPVFVVKGQGGFIEPSVASSMPLMRQNPIFQYDNDGK